MNKQERFFFSSLKKDKSKGINKIEGGTLYIDFLGLLALRHHSPRTAGREKLK